MNKYSNEFKLEVIKYYLEGQNSYNKCCERFSIPSATSIKRWVHKYELYGVEGLKKQLTSNYDGKYKQNVVEFKHENHLSATETSNFFKISNASTVLEWERIYYEKGPQGLYRRQCGRGKNMASKLEKKKNTNENEDLLKEVEYLRMENEYLKKLNALVQERVKQENKKK